MIISLFYRETNSFFRRWSHGTLICNRGVIEGDLERWLSMDEHNRSAHLEQQLLSSFWDNDLFRGNCCFWFISIFKGSLAEEIPRQRLEKIMN